ncbi:uncharacterized protein [Amphiura filiformis]|uniref:uncharacterized protein n=1 Tax=Amphiura filiformis TaxID=82378 RepID=UPI003B216236
MNDSTKVFEEKENALKAKLAEVMLHAKEAEKAKKLEEDLARVEMKYQELVKKHEVLEKELKEVKEKESKATKYLAEVKQQHKSQLTQLQVTEKDIKQQHEQKEQENTRIFAAAQQEASNAQEQHEEQQQRLSRKLAVAQQAASDAQKKKEESEKKAKDLNQALQSLRQRHQAQNGDGQNVLESLRVNVLNLLRTLIDEETLDNLDINDPRSAQVDNLVQRVLDENS